MTEIIRPTYPDSTSPAAAEAAAAADNLAYPSDTPDWVRNYPNVTPVEGAYTGYGKSPDIGDEARFSARTLALQELSAKLKVSVKSEQEIIVFEKTNVGTEGTDVSYEEMVRDQLNINSEVKELRGFLDESFVIEEGPHRGAYARVVLKEAVWQEISFFRTRLQSDRTLTLKEIQTLVDVITRYAAYSGYPIEGISVERDQQTRNPQLVLLPTPEVDDEKTCMEWLAGLEPITNGQLKVGRLQIGALTRPEIQSGELNLETIETVLKGLELLTEAKENYYGILPLSDLLARDWEAVSSEGFDHLNRLFVEPAALAVLGPMMRAGAVKITVSGQEHGWTSEEKRYFADNLSNAVKDAVDQLIHATYMYQPGKKDDNQKYQFSVETTSLNTLNTLNAEPLVFEANAVSTASGEGVISLRLTHDNTLLHTIEVPANGETQAVFAKAATGLLSAAAEYLFTQRIGTIVLTEEQVGIAVDFFGMGILQPVALFQENGQVQEGRLICTYILPAESGSFAHYFSEISLADENAVEDKPFVAMVEAVAGDEQQTSSRYSIFDQNSKADVFDAVQVLKAIQHARNGWNSDAVFNLYAAAARQRAGKVRSLINPDTLRLPAEYRDYWQLLEIYDLLKTGDKTPGMELSVLSKTVEALKEAGTLSQVTSDFFLEFFRYQLGTSSMRTIAADRLVELEPFLTGTDFSPEWRADLNRILGFANYNKGNLAESFNRFLQAFLLTSGYYDDIVEMITMFPQDWRAFKAEKEKTADYQIFKQQMTELMDIRELPDYQKARRMM